MWFHCSFKTPFRQRFEICGSQKSIIIDDLALPSDVRTSYMLKSSGLTNYDLLTFHEREQVVPDVGPVHVSIIPVDLSFVLVQTTHISVCLLTFQ